MNKEKAMKYFQDNFSEMKKMICGATIWAEYPDKELFEQIAKGLIALADKGDKNAAGLYCMIAAYSDHAGSFSMDVAVQLLLDSDAVDIYHKLLEEEFYSVVDEDFYDYLYALPAIHLLEKISAEESTNEEKSEQE